MRFRNQIVLGALLLVLIGLTTLLGPEQSQAVGIDPNEEKAEESTSILFERVRIFNGISDQLSDPSNVLVIGNKISTISKDPILKIYSDKFTKIKGDNLVLMPGLIDDHWHSFFSANIRQDLLNDEVGPKTLTQNAEKEAERTLLRGFTTVRDVGGPVFELKRKIDKGDVPGPRIYPSGAVISQTSGHGDFGTLDERPRRFGGKLSHAEDVGASIIADGVDEVLTATRENLRHGASQIKLMAGGGVASVYDPLDVLEYTKDELKAAVQAAEDWGTYVTVHVYNSEGIRRAIDAGVKCIEHGHLMDESTMKLLADKEIWLSMQPFEFGDNTYSTEEQQEKNKAVSEGTTNVYNWAKKYKVKLAWGTDLLFDPDATEKQNHGIVKLKKWFTPFEALKMVTHDNAELLTLSGLRNPYPGKLGVIEEDAYADLLLVEGNPLEDLDIMEKHDTNFMEKHDTNFTNFKVIVKDGKIYKNDFEPKPLVLN